MTDTLENLISNAVVARITPGFIEKEVATRVEKLIVESVDRALRSYSDTGKLIEKAVEDALRVDRIDLPSYGSVVTGILKTQIECRVSELVAGKLSEDMADLLSLAPKEIKLSQIAADMLVDRDYGTEITVIVETSEYGSTWLYLDEDNHRSRQDKYRCDYRLLIGKDGKISSGTVKERELKAGTSFGRGYGLDQKLRAYYACGTIIHLDEDAVITQSGDY